MKINCCIAAAILVYGATAAPVNNTRTSLDLLGPISLLVSPDGIIRPAIAKNPSKPSENPTNLEKFPIISEALSLIPLHHKGHKNKTSKKQDHSPLDKFLQQKIADAFSREHDLNITTKPPPPVLQPGQGGLGPATQPSRGQNTTLAKRDNYDPFAEGLVHGPMQGSGLETGKDVELSKRDAGAAAQGLVDDFKNGNLTAARLFSLKGAILSLQPEDRTTQHNVNKAVLSYFQRAVHGIFERENCTLTKVQPRSINHSHDKESKIINDCKIKIEEKTYKEANTIVDHARTRISTVHSESSREKHKTLDDAADTIKTLANLPPELRTFYLNELAKLNSTSNNTFDSKTESETSTDSWTKTTSEDGSVVGSGFEFNTSSKTHNKVHEEVVIDLTKPSSVAATQVNSEIRISKPSSSFSIVSLGGITTAASDKLTSTASSSSYASTTSASNKIATSSSASLSSIPSTFLPASTQAPSSTVGSSSAVSLSSSEPTSTSSSSLVASTSTPSTSKSSIGFKTVDIPSLMSRIREYQSTMSTSSSSTTLSSTTSSISSEAKSFSRSSSKISVIAPLSSTSALRSSSSTLSSSTTSLKTTSSSSSIPTSSTISTSTTSLSSPSSSTPIPTSSSLPNDDDIEEPPTHSSSGEPLLPVTAPSNPTTANQPKPDHASYILKLQTLNDAHMLEMQACKHNNTCITDSTRRFALAITDLDLDYDLVEKRGLGKRGEFEDLKEKAEEWEEKLKDGWS
ncbi:hypothetical protein BDZ45DRAFT_789742 [Acephala macrosclerotiorum]|nr:hypothetical protein BDZ45DRAFT_789742 [Acephala macrosclerotiorum]